jgi:hypothetical protein
MSSRTNSHCLLASFPVPKEREIEIGENFWGMDSVASPSLSNYGTPTGPHERGVYDSDIACNLSCARPPHIPALVEG